MRAYKDRTGRSTSGRSFAVGGCGVACARPSRHARTWRTPRSGEAPVSRFRPRAGGASRREAARIAVYQRLAGRDGLRQPRGLRRRLGRRHVRLGLTGPRDLGLDQRLDGRPPVQQRHRGGRAPGPRRRDRRRPVQQRRAHRPLEAAGARKRLGPRQLVLPRPDRRRRDRPAVGRL